MTENLEILITEHMRALTSETLTKNREVLITEHSEMAVRAWNRVDLSHARRYRTNSFEDDQISEMSFIIISLILP